MNSFDFNAVTYNGDCYCSHCLPGNVDINSDEVMPIFTSDEVDNYPVCCVCGYEHDYMSKIEYENGE